ncbi:glycosyl transferase family 1 [Arcticibacter tournemirensis]|uniref:Glycosyltransferase family 4 protein n=1 Tax=Arcticibacter tournemirensis TaxID=699437 RepID=A0A5M9H6W3_9SPHI|nr:glycosyltransferase [Arcticibacter tournemirensis]KAA8482029.1 glycosyltransferase family 4 protein [Arcticibacter tournemirensis]TQM49434.1 glycosyl transferase family 1 [Arcticibacter tournemirensis]
MNIIHYALGLPPYRSGGLTKYAVDLMSKQAENPEDIITLLHPGEITLEYPQKGIRRRGSYNRISIYEISNPSIVPLLHGVRKPSDLLSGSPLTERTLENFYNILQPDILHIHTVMGIPVELVKFLRQKGVKIIYTSHDYFGLCFKVSFINQRGELCNTPGGKECELCNRNSPSNLFLRLRNSRFLLKYKSSLSVGKKIGGGRSAVTKTIEKPFISKNAGEFEDVIGRFKELFYLVDCFHFNSSIAKEVYQQFLHLERFSIVPISHASIFDNRIFKRIDTNNIRLGFIGHVSDYKGFPLLKDVLCALSIQGVSNWSLNVWGGETGVDKDCDLISYRGKYDEKELKSVFEEIDLLIVPSIWKETFSLITLEALSFGTPVLVSTNVGAKDIVKEYQTDFVCEPTVEAFSKLLLKVLREPSLLSEYNARIIQGEFNYSFGKHVTEIYNLYNNRK